jgi:hypothetical protein
VLGTGVYDEYADGLLFGWSPVHRLVTPDHGNNRSELNGVVP